MQYKLVKLKNKINSPPPKKTGKKHKFKSRHICTTIGLDLSTGCQACKQTLPPPPPPRTTPMVAMTSILTDLRYLFIILPVQYRGKQAETIQYMGCICACTGQRTHLSLLLVCLLTYMYYSTIQRDTWC